MTSVAAVILAAGQGTRFQAATGRPDSKLLAVIAGRPLVRHVAEAAIASRATPVIAVTGYRAEEVGRALADLPLRLVNNPDYPAGLSTSLKVGIAAVPPQCRGALVLLADMPGINRDTIEALVVRAVEQPNADAVVVVRNGRRGNPVLLGRSLFARVARLDGDEGARGLLAHPDVRIETVAHASQATVDDVDHPDDIARLAAQARNSPASER